MHQDCFDVSDMMKMLRQSVLDRTDIGGISQKCSMGFHRRDGNKVASDCHFVWINITWPENLVDVASWMR